MKRCSQLLLRAHIGLSMLEVCLCICACRRCGHSLIRTKKIQNRFSKVRYWKLADVGILGRHNHQPRSPQGSGKDWTRSAFVLLMRLDVSWAIMRCKRHIVFRELYRPVGVSAELKTRVTFPCNRFNCWRQPFMLPRFMRRMWTHARLTYLVQRKIACGEGVNDGEHRFIIRIIRREMQGADC